MKEKVLGTGVVFQAGYEYSVGEHLSWKKVVVYRKSLYTGDTILWYPTEVDYDHSYRYSIDGNGVIFRELKPPVKKILGRT